MYGFCRVYQFVNSFIYPFFLDIMDPNTEDAESQNVEDRFHHDAAQYKVSYPKGRNTKQVSWVGHYDAQIDFWFLVLFMPLTVLCIAMFCLFRFRWMMLQMKSATKRGISCLFCISYSHLFLIKSYIWNFTPSRYPVSRSGNNPGRVKRVVSCKRKTHHLTVARRKQLGSGRTCDAVNKENETKVLQGTQQDIFSMDPWDFPFHVNNINNNQGTDRTGSEEADYCVLTEVSKTFSCLHCFMNYFSCKHAAETT